MLFRINVEILLAQQLIRVNIYTRHNDDFSDDNIISQSVHFYTFSFWRILFVWTSASCYADVFSVCRCRLLQSFFWHAKRITINNWHEPRMLIILGDDHDGWQNTTNSRYTSKNAGNFPYKFYVDSYQLIAFKGKGNSFLLGCENHPSTTHHQPQSTPPHPLQYFSFKNI
jgi:hypothetical protein